MGTSSYFIGQEDLFLRGNQSRVQCQLVNTKALSVGNSSATHNHRAPVVKLLE